MADQSTIYSGRHITESEWLALRDAYRQYGTSFPFWDTYDEILVAAAARSEDTLEAKSELLLAAVNLGAVCARDAGHLPPSWPDLTI